MRIARFGDNRLGLVEGYVLRDITLVTERMPHYRWPFPVGDQLIAHLESLRRTIKGAGEASARIPVTEVKLLSPVANPPRSTSGVTHAGMSRTGVREPIRSAPLAIPRSTAVHCSAFSGDAALASCASTYPRLISIPAWRVPPPLPPGSEPGALLLS